MSGSQLRVIIFEVATVIVNTLYQTTIRLWLVSMSVSQLCVIILEVAPVIVNTLY